MESVKPREEPVLGVDGWRDGSWGFITSCFQILNQLLGISDKTSHVLLFFAEHGGLPSVTSSVSASVIKSPSDPSHASIPPPPLLLPAATTRSNSTSMPNSIPSLENKPPQAIVKPQILTHVIEGFVIQEGLEPFPVSLKVARNFFTINL